MVVYATPEELKEWTGEEYPNAISLLREASAVVDSLLKGAVYETDAAEYPTDPKIRRVLRDATCAQAAWKAETGGLGGASALGSLRFDSTNESYSGVASSVLMILTVEGIIDTSPGVLR